MSFQENINSAIRNAGYMSIGKKVMEGAESSIAANQQATQESQARVAQLTYSQHLGQYPATLAKEAAKYTAVRVNPNPLGYTVKPNEAIDVPYKQLDFNTQGVNPEYPLNFTSASTATYSNQRADSNGASKNAQKDATAQRREFIKKYKVEHSGFRFNTDDEYYLNHKMPGEKTDGGKH